MAEYKNVTELMIRLLDYNIQEVLDVVRYPSIQDELAWFHFDQQSKKGMII